MRAQAARNLHDLQLLDRLLRLRARAGLSVLTVLTYHRIGDSGMVGELDPDVREIDARGLAEQIDMIGAVGTIVSLDEVRGFFRGRRSPRNPVMLAFDDGYAECRDVVLPILKRIQVPATFFIPTAFPDAGRLFWWDRIHLLLRRCHSPEIRLHYPFPMILDVQADISSAHRHLLRLVKDTKNLDLPRFFEDLERATNVTLTAAEEKKIAQETVLSFRDVRALQDAGMAVASHSHAHRVLATLAPDEVVVDLRKSRLILHDVLGADVRTIGYPVGHPVNGSIRRAAVLAGFDLGFTNATGLCWSATVDPLNVPRLAIGRDEPPEIYKWRMLVG